MAIGRQRPGRFAKKEEKKKKLGEITRKKKRKRKKEKKAATTRIALSPCHYLMNIPNPLLFFFFFVMFLAFFSSFFFYFKSFLCLLKGIKELVSSLTHSLGSI